MLVILTKSLRSKLIPKKVLVSRKDPKTGKIMTYTTTVYVNPEQKITNPRETINKLSQRCQEILQMKNLPSEIRGRAKISKAGKIFETLLTEALRRPDYVEFKELVKSAPKHIQDFLNKYSYGEQRLIEYNVLMTTLNIKEYALQQGKIVVGADFVGDKVGTGFKADVVVYFQDKNKQAFMDLSKLQLNEENYVGISLKTKNRGKWIGLQETTYKSLNEQLNLSLKIPPDYNKPENRETRKFIHQQILKIPQEELRKKLENFISTLFEDKNFPDMMMLIRDFKANKTYYGKEKDVKKLFIGLIQKCKFNIQMRKNKEGIGSIDWIHPKTGEKLIYSQTHLSRGTYIVRINYNFMKECLKNA